MPFYNPYQFVPLSAPNTAAWTEVSAFDGRDIGHHSHARYTPAIGPNSDPVHSGRLICRLETITQAFVGGANRTEGDQERNQPATVEPYKIDNEAAIPASTLRGMISAVAEAASDSALRVLENRYFSYRQKLGEGLSAIGMLKTPKQPGCRFELVPLTLPTLNTRGATYALSREWQRVFGGARLGDHLPAYIDGYQSVLNTQGRHDRLEVSPGSFLDTHHPECFRATKPVFFYARLPGLVQSINGPIGTGTPGCKEKSTGGRTFLLGQMLQAFLLNGAQWNALANPSEKARYTKGILRVLGIDGREDKVPEGKRHELFIPVAHTLPRLPVSDEALDRFQRLGEEREEAGEPPFAPHGYPDWRPASGILVYFDVELDNGGNVSVSAISLSSTWRGEVPARAHDFFRTVSHELMPFNASRQYISPAEWLFGFVEVNEGEEEINRPARTFAGKVQFSPARLVTVPEGNSFGDAVTLKVLNTPKLPCPAMYFAAPDGTPKKSELAAGTHNPNGRKFYLHTWQENGEVVKLNKKGLRDANGKEPWRSHNSPNGPKPHLKVRITPLKKGCVFYFHVDFDNLSAAELDLLCFALQPDGLFHHKIGMGKPIGLGTVRVSIEGLFLVDRLARYDSDDMFGGYRYHQVWGGDQHGAEWRNRYPMEGAAAAGRPTIGAQDQPEHRAARYLKQHSDSATRALLILGNPQNVRYPVHYPQRANEDVEVETFRWFVHNEPRATHPKQRLHWNGTGNLPPLER